METKNWHCAHWHSGYFETEGKNAYHQGGLHPIRLGDVLEKGQYKILRKLGYGDSATVWLARDLLNKTYVAVKIQKANHTQPLHELQMQRSISETAPYHAPKCITQLLDTFEHTGPNGVHQCLVFEPMGPTVDTMVHGLPGKALRYMYPAWMAKRILKQTLQALEFLHCIGISHGDLHPENMFFDLRSKASFDAIPEDELLQPEDVKGMFITEPLRKEGDDADPSLPLYLYASKPLLEFADISASFRIKLSGVGSSYYTQTPPAAIKTPIALRAPEYVLLGEVNKTQDIWSFGCLVYQFIRGFPLFFVEHYETELYTNDQHLLEISRVLGDLPDELYRHWKTSAWYFTPTRELYNHVPRDAEDKKPRAYCMRPFYKQTLEEQWDKEGPVMDEADASQVKALIRRILQYDPAKRPSALELLDDPWFQQIDVESKGGEKEGNDTTLRWDVWVLWLFGVWVLWLFGVWVLCLFCYIVRVLYG